MSEPQPPDPDSQDVHATEPAAVSRTARIVALLEVILCSDYPTQIALGSTFVAFGYKPLGAGGELSVGFVAVFSLLDTALLIGLMLIFLYAHGERPVDVFLGSRP